MVDITTGGECVYYKFTPDEERSYIIYSEGDMDTLVYLYDESGNPIKYYDYSDSDGDDNNFCIGFYCENVGSSYYICVCLADPERTGSFDLRIQKDGE